MNAKGWASLLGAAGLGFALLGAPAAPAVRAQQGRAQEGASEPSCPAVGFTPQLLTPMSGRHPRDAGLVVGLVPGGEHHRLPPILLERRRREIDLAPEPLAPGLYRLRPDTRRIWGRYTVSGVAGEPELLFARAQVGAPPSAPRIERIARYLVASGEGPRTEVKAHFAFPTPESAVALVAYWGDDDTPDLYARATPTRREAVLFSQQGDCARLPDGATAPPTEGTARLAYVDRFGQLGEPSEPHPLGP